MRRLNRLIVPKTGKIIGQVADGRQYVERKSGHPSLKRNLQLHAQPYCKSGIKNNAPCVGWRERFLILTISNGNLK
jgi:hypothetical protein